MSHSRTPFAHYAHADLLRMLAAGVVDDVQQAGDRWRQAGRSLAERADELGQQLEEFSADWHGQAAGQYGVMMRRLIDGIEEVVDEVTLTRDLVYSASDCLHRAQQQMPDLVSVPTLSPLATMFAAATDQAGWNALTPAQQTALMTAWSALDPAQQRQVVHEVRDLNQAVADADTAHAKAVAVMRQLASQYCVIHDAVPAMPKLVHAPEVPTTPDQAGLGHLHLINTDQDPLFGDMYNAGLRAASSALRNDLDPPPDGLADEPGLGGLGKGLGAALGGIGAGALAGLGGLGAKNNADKPTASPVFADPGGATSPALLALAPAAAVGTAAAVRGGMPMGGMMPFLPMGGGGEGGMSRRAPNWLVEREPVFDGEGVPVTPTIIGAEAPEPPPAPRFPRRSGG